MGRGAWGVECGAWGVGRGTSASDVGFGGWCVVPHAGEGWLAFKPKPTPYAHAYLVAVVPTTVHLTHVIHRADDRFAIACVRPVAIDLEQGMMSAGCRGWIQCGGRVGCSAIGQVCFDNAWGWGCDGVQCGGAGRKGDGSSGRGGPYVAVAALIALDGRTTRARIEHAVIGLLRRCGNHANGG